MGDKSIVYMTSHLLYVLFVFAVEVSGARGEYESVGVNHFAAAEHDFDIGAGRGVVESARVAVNKSFVSRDVLVKTCLCNPAMLLVPVTSPSRDMVIDWVGLGQCGVMLRIDRLQRN